MVEPWLTDVSVEGPGGKGTFGGSNGIKAHAGWVYYTSRGSLWRVKIGKANAAEGAPEMFAKIGGDDFTIAKDGTIYLPGGNGLNRISPQGEISKVLDLGFDCPTAMLSADGKSVYVVNRGGAPGAANGPASKLYRIWLEG